MLNELNNCINKSELNKKKSLVPMQTNISFLQIIFNVMPLRVQRNIYLTFFPSVHDEEYSQDEAD